MADKDMLDFLAEVKAYDADIEVRDDVAVAVATVGGPFVEYHSEEEHAAWIVEACHRASRTCETCKHWSRIYDCDFGFCGFWTDDRSIWHTYDDERCRNWQGEEAADG